MSNPSTNNNLVLNSKNLKDKTKHYTYINKFLEKKNCGFKRKGVTKIRELNQLLIVTKPKKRKISPIIFEGLESKEKAKDYCKKNKGRIIAFKKKGQKSYIVGENINDIYNEIKKWENPKVYDITLEGKPTRLALSIQYNKKFNKDLNIGVLLDSALFYADIYIKQLLPKLKRDKDLKFRIYDASSSNNIYLKVYYPFIIFKTLINLKNFINNLKILINNNKKFKINSDDCCFNFKTYEPNKLIRTACCDEFEDNRPFYYVDLRRTVIRELTEDMLKNKRVKKMRKIIWQNSLICCPEASLENCISYDKETELNDKEYINNKDSTNNLKNHHYAEINEKDTLDFLILKRRTENGLEIKKIKGINRIELYHKGTHTCPSCKVKHVTGGYGSKNCYFIVFPSKGKLEFACYEDKEEKRVSMGSFIPISSKNTIKLLKPILPLNMFANEYKQKGAVVEKNEWLSPIEYIKNKLNRRVLIIFALLGMGKTMQVAKYIIDSIEKNKKIKILWLGPRISFIKSLLKRLLEEYNIAFKSYLDKELETKPTKDVQFLISSPESLWRYEGGIPDLLIIDEFTAVKRQFSSLKTNGDKLEKNNQIWKNIIQNNSVEALILGGGINQLSLDLFDKWNLDYGLYINTTIKEKGKAILIEKYTQFSHEMEEDLNNNKNIYHHSASKEKIENLKIKFKPLLEKKKKKLSFLKGTEDILNFIWLVALALVTSVITVGIDINDIHFHIAYLYVSSMGCLVADSIQGISRVRNLIDKTIKFHVYCRGNSYGIPKTLKDVIKFQEYKNEQIDDLIRIHNPIRCFETIPDWMKLNYRHTILEENLSKSFTKELTNIYLTQLGYEIEKQPKIVIEKDDKDNKIEKSVKGYDDIVDVTELDDDQVEYIYKKAKDKRNKMTEEDRLVYEKLKFHERIKIPQKKDDNGKIVEDEDDDSHKILFEQVWLKDKSSIFGRIKLEKADMGYILDDEIRFSKVKEYAGLTPLQIKEAKNILNWLGVDKIDDEEKEIPRAKLVELYNSPLLDGFIKPFRLSKPKKKVLEKHESREMQKLLNSIFKRYLFKLKVGSQKQKRVKGKRKNNKKISKSPYILMTQYKISSLIK